MVKIDRRFFWLGIVTLLVGIEFFIFSNLSIIYFISGAFMLMSSFLFIYLGRFHLVQILYHYEFKDYNNYAKELAEKLDIEISNKKGYYEKLKNEIKELEEKKNKLKKK